MKDYTSEKPVFSDLIRIVEPSDPGHADNITPAPKQLLQNTLVNRAAIMEICGLSGIEKAFHEVFDGETVEDDSGAMTAAEIESAINTPWDGISSSDPAAMTKEEVEEGTGTAWNGQASADAEALKPDEIESATKLS